MGGISLILRLWQCHCSAAQSCLRSLRRGSRGPRSPGGEGFITALPGMASVFLLMGIIFYIGSVISTQLFGADFPQWFGSLGRRPIRCSRS